MNERVAQKRLQILEGAYYPAFFLPAVSVTRLDDLLYFGQFFKAFSNN